MSRFDPERICVVSLSDTGRQRSSNQDLYGESRAPDGSRVLIVADGMGGHAGGETASRIAVETVCARVEGASQAPELALRDALAEANRAIFERARGDAGLAGMGTTGVALWFGPGGASAVAHVGDSRAYRLRGGRLERLTEDHSLVAELQRRGLLSEEQAAVHPRRNELLRSLGIDPEVEVDVAPVELEPGDCFLLCSDGLCGVLADDEIAAVLAREAPEQAARSLVDGANERGGPDNITVQIARVPDDA